MKELLLLFCLSTPHAIDGDTFKACGVSVRLSDYDLPELYHSRCPKEYALAVKAKIELEQRSHASI
jgi:endonuclease YncB( thermonuclease family)